MTNKNGKASLNKITTLVDTLLAHKSSKQQLIYCNNSSDEVTSDYRQLYSQSLQLLSHLNHLGLRKGDQLVFQLEGLQHFTTTFWACILGGIIPVPISVGTKDDSLKKVFSVWALLNNPTLCFDSPILLENLEKYSQRTGSQSDFAKIRDKALDLSLLPSNSDKNLASLICDVNPDDTAFIQFSSGSTGQPKGVVLTHKNLVANIKALANCSETTINDVMISWMPLTHDMGLIAVHLTATLLAIKQVLIDTRTFIRRPLLWLDKTSQHQGTILFTPNYGLNVLLLSMKKRQPDWDLSRVRIILNGAEPISLTLAEQFLATMAPYGLAHNSMYPVYGLAEASVAVSVPKPGAPIKAHYLDRTKLNFQQEIVHVMPDNPDAITFIEVGTAIDECAIKIADATGKDIPDNHIGLIHIKGANVTSGYFHNQEETRRVLHPDGWLNTGDLGFINNQQLTITGRAKDLIIINGQNIYAHDIEQMCARIPEIQLRNIVACSVCLNKNNIEQLVIFIRYKQNLDEFTNVADKLRRYLQTSMGLSIHALVPINDIPKTTSGKVQRFQLQQNFINGDYQPILNEIKQLQQTQSNTQLPPMSDETLHYYLHTTLTKLLGYQVTNYHDKLADHGVNSLKVVEFHAVLQETLAIEIPVSSFFDYPTFTQLENFLLEQVKAQTKPPENLQLPDTKSIRQEKEAIAIIGFAGQFPGSQQSNETFYNNLYEGKDLCSEIPSDRWCNKSYYDQANTPGSIKTQKGYFLDQVNEFDASFFGITPVEAKVMDPQQRLLLTVSQHAIDNAGIRNESLNGSKTAVYIAMANSDFAHQSFEQNRSSTLKEHSLTGNIASIASGRISYYYGLTGPCLTLDTACSSSLVAVDLACTSLLTGKADQALVGGVNLILTPQGYISLSRVNALSDDGKCKVFDDSANGYGRGEGCAMLVLKRLSDAQRDGDSIRAIIAGSSVNHDGKSSGLTVPNGLAQQQVICDAMAQAKVGIHDIHYLEAHGTGTKLGDPQELNALSNIFEQRAANNPLPVGSIKSNIGHLEAVAGIAGVIKLILSMEHGIVPKNLHLNQYNRLVPWDKIPLKPLSEHHTLDNTQKITCGISSFGLSGTNSHLILQNNPISEAIDIEDDKAGILILTAKTLTSLHHCKNQYIDFLNHSQHSAQDITTVSQRNQQDYPYRLAVVGRDKASLLAQLIHDTYHSVPTENPGNIAFIFTGQGSQYFNMAKALHQHFSVFNIALAECAQLFSPYLNKSIEDVLYQDGSELIDNTLYAQPIIFSIGYALIKLFENFGIKPQFVLGHSIGQYTAALAAGVLTLTDAVHLVANRALLMSKVKLQGAMVAVAAPISIIQDLVTKQGNSVAIAAINSPVDVTLSGSIAEINLIIEAMIDLGLPYRELKVSHAFHSPLMQSVLEPFSHILDEVTLHPPKLPIVSDLTGFLTTPGKHSEITHKDYWLTHICDTITFSAGLDTLSKHGCHAFVEIGGTATLSAFAAKTLKSHSDLLNLASQRGALKPSLDTFYQTLADLYVHHYPVNWKAMESHPLGKIIDLPYYGFEKTTFPIHADALESTSTQPTTSRENTQPLKPISLPSVGIINSLARLIEGISGIKLDQQKQHLNFLNLGLDSLMLARLKNEVFEEFSIDIPLAYFYDQCSSGEKLHHYLSERITLQPEPFNNQQPQPDEPQQVSLSNPVTSNDDIANLLGQQLQTVQAICQAQLNYLGKDNITNSEPSKAIPPSPRTAYPETNFRLTKFSEDNLSDTQQAFVNQLISAYCIKTAKSKAFSQTHKGDFAHYLTSLNFRKTLKEILYPLVSNEAKGAYLWDIDNNKYIDLAIGYGVHFFGHKPQFVIDAVKQQMDKGFVLSPHSSLLGEVTQLLKEITGVDRVSYCNTGSEAVMLALRIARTQTGRTKIVKFSGSYHGIYDAILAENDEQGSYPTTPGITLGSVQDTIVLTYGDPKALEIIEQLGTELAAVLVEPVQSRNPALQPKTFLAQLRALTTASDTVLIFDEIITGFRLQSGGAQAFFDIQADLVTYGKIIGGGLPIGIVAGKRRFMDVIDGGLWQYQDDSIPQTTATFIAGTFANHPMALAAAKSVLLEIKAKGALLYQQTNALTLSLVTRLNDYFAANQVPIEVKCCGPIFRFESFGRYALALQPIEMDLFFYLMMTKGIYTWERRICFMSTCHTRVDIDNIITAVIDSINELRQGGFTFTTTTSPLPPKESLRKSSQQHSLMSSAQKRLFTLNSLKGAEQAYHLSYIAKINGPIDANRAQQALTLLSQRHQSLRTTFELLEGEFIRVVHPELPPRLEQATAETLAQSSANFFRPFDLKNDAMLRAKLVNLAPNEHVFMLDIHHIAADGYSANILFQEFISAYSNNGDTTLATPSQFEDFVNWETDYLTSTKFQLDRQYWQNNFANYQQTTQLPLDHQRPTQQTFNGHTHSFSLSPAKTAQLTALAKQLNVSLYMLLLSGCHLLLSRLTGNNETIIGAPVALRQPKGFNHIVGMLTNTVVYKHHLDNHHTFEGLVHSVKENCLGVYAHQEYPFDQLVAQHFEQSGMRRDRSRNPLFDVSFVFEQADDRVLAIPELEFIPQTLAQKGSVYDFSFEVIVQQQQLSINFHYNQNLFNLATIASWGDLTLLLLDNVLQSPKQKLEHILPIPVDIPAELEAEQQLDWSESAHLIERFNAVAKLYPNHVAVKYQDKTISYKQLDQKSNQLAHMLKEQYNICPKERIAVQVESGDFLISALIAVLKLGCCYIPIDPDAPREKVNYILKDSAAKVLLTESHLYQQDFYSRCDLNRVDYAVFSQQPLVTAITADTLAYIIYTSGTTGRPKGVKIRHSSLMNYCRWLTGKYAINHMDSSVLLSSYAFDLGYTSMWGCLLSGASLHLLDKGARQDIRFVLHYIAQQHLTFIKMTPSLFQVLVNHHDFTPALGLTLRLMILGGEKLRADDVANYLQCFKETVFVNHYGPTEATIGCITREFNAATFEQYRHNMSIGQPIANCKVYILDHNNTVVADGEQGEICIEGDCLAQGYLNHDVLEQAKFITLPLSPDKRVYKTGDCGVIINHEVHIHGRFDDQVKIRGYRVELGEVINVLEQHPKVQRAAVINKQNKSGNELVAYYQSSEPVTVTDLRKFMSEHLPAYTCPSHYLEVVHFPTNANGKLDINKLLNSHEKTPISITTTTDKLSASQQVIFDVWQQHLQIPSMGLTDDFFALGGHSLKAMLISAALSQKFSTPVSINEIFAHPNIAALDLWLTTNEQSLIEISPIKPQAFYALSSAQKRLWLVSQVKEQSVAYNVHAAFLLEGELCIPSFKQAFSQLICRHESLRTNFIFTQGEPKQHIHSAIELPLTLLEPAAITINSPALNQLYLELAQHHFNLETDALFQITVVKLSTEKPAQVLMFNAHHIICDGWSNSIILKELSELYTCYRRQQAPTLQPLVIQYKDYAAWHNKVLNTAQALNDKAFWQTQLAGVNHPMLLPNASNTERYSGHWYRSILDEALASAMQDYCRHNSISLYTFFASATSVLLSHYCATDEIIYATPIADRQLPQLQSQVGFYLNTFLLRQALTPELSFADLLNTTKTQLHNIMQHQLYPVEQVLEELDLIEGTIGDFYRIILNVMEYESYSHYQLDGLRFNKILETATTSRADLNIMLVKGDALELVIEYNNQLLDEAGITTMKDQLIQLISQILEQPQRTIRELKQSLLSTREQQAQAEFLDAALAIDEEF
ncbi:amino acid adenylation domain-containing protein [Iodobacter arcticus]|uniref:Amino acid adenylation domain-containing protein n=1 Tax=Iodobacter arcticus TaxID=590593 RepID=A0ABW2QSV2_9NEIS